MQPIPLKWSAARWCYFLFATLMFSPNPMLFLPSLLPHSFSTLSPSNRWSLSLLISLLCILSLAVLVLSSEIYDTDAAFSTVFAVSFLFIPSIRLAFFLYFFSFSKPPPFSSFHPVLGTAWLRRPPPWFLVSLLVSSFLFPLVSPSSSWLPPPYFSLPRFVHQCTDWISTGKMRPY